MPFLFYEENLMKKVTVYGAGYVGLVTAACLAELGHDVLCMDVDSNKIDLLKKGKSPIYEPGLSELLIKNFSGQTLRFSTDEKEAVLHGDFHFIAVATPQSSSGAAELKYVYEVAETIAKHRIEPCIVINKSTVPVGTAEKVTALLHQTAKAHHKALQFSVVSNPEFLREGTAIKDFFEPDRIIIGADDRQQAEKVKELYKPLSLANEKILLLSTGAAELTKYASNAFLATKISFINEISRLAEKTHVDIEEVRLGMGSDPRIGTQFLLAGCGYGGSCFPKDVSALNFQAHQAGVELFILDAVTRVNAYQKKWIVKKVKHYFEGNLAQKTFAIWGLAFKPDTDDMREASSIVIIKELLDAGAFVQAYDPIATENAKKVLPESEALMFASDPMSALLHADALLIVTEWNEFKHVDLEQVKKHLKNPVMFDGRNIFDPTKVLGLGFEYFGMGRGLTLL